MCLCFMVSLLRKSQFWFEESEFYKDQEENITFSSDALSLNDKRGSKLIRHRQQRI